MTRPEVSGKLYAAVSRGKKSPEGWATDVEGMSLPYAVVRDLIEGADRIGVRHPP